MPSPIPLLTAHASSTLPPKKEHLPTNVILPSSESGWYSKNLTSDDRSDGDERGKRHKLLIGWDGAEDVVAVCVTFQGGFVGLGGSVRVVECVGEEGTGDGGGGGDLPPGIVEGDDDVEVDEWGEFEDGNMRQVVAVGGRGEKVEMTWDGSTDFYGRVIVYGVEVWRAGGGEGDGEE